MGSEDTMTGDDILLGIFLIMPVALVLALLAFFRRTGGLRGKVTWVRIVFGNILICAFLLSLLTVGGEIYYRFLYDTTDSLAYTKVTRQWMDRYVRVNSSNYRDNIEYLREIPAGVRRISFLGDSFTEGHGVRSVEDRFVNRIRAMHPEWEVHGLSEKGADTSRELYLLNKAVEDGYQLDVVVLVYCINDIEYWMPDWQDQLKKVYGDSMRGGWVRQHSFFFDTLYHRLKVMREPAMKGYFDYIIDGYKGAPWNEETNWLAAIRDLVRSRGGRLLLVTFPFLHAVGPDYKFQLAHDQVARWCREQEVPELDLLPVYSNLPPGKITVNRYDAHPNEYAHQLAAEAIEPFLKTNLDFSTKQTGSSSK